MSSFLVQKCFSGSFLSFAISSLESFTLTSLKWQLEWIRSINSKLQYIVYKCRISLFNFLQLWVAACWKCNEKTRQTHKYINIFVVTVTGSDFSFFEKQDALPNCNCYHAFSWVFRFPLLYTLYIVVDEKVLLLRGYYR